MNELQIFEKAEFGKVRIVMRNGEPWFVARDVAVALGYADPADAIQRHCKKINDSNMGVSPSVPSPKIIPESDVYRLVMRSNLPTAIEFQDWVCEEVKAYAEEERQKGIWAFPVPRIFPCNPIFPRIYSLSGLPGGEPERKAKVSPYPLWGDMTFPRSGSGLEPPVASGPCGHCIMPQVRSFPADAPPSPRLLLSRLCASGMGSWFPCRA